MENQNLQTYLSFNIGDELHAINVFQVIEVIENQKITEVPDAPTYIDGVINFRGDVIPVINLAIKLNYQEINSDNSVVIVLELTLNNKQVRLGMKCSKVDDVVQYDVRQMKNIPNLGYKIKSEFIEGLMQINDNLITILNLNKIALDNTI